MDIKTKFEVYDEIWFLGNKKAVKSKIRGIKILVSSSPIEISEEVTYLCSSIKITDEEDDPRVFIKVNEDDAFKTKEELLQTL